MNNYFKEKYNKGGLLKSPYDQRDYDFRDLVPLKSFHIPDNYETEEIPFIYDQGTSSMCCACSYNSIRYLQEKDKEQSELTEAFSPCFTYGNRIAGEDFEGMYLRSCCKKGREGSILLSELPGFYSYPEAKRLVNCRKQELLEKAAPYAISSFYTCRSRRDIQNAIIATKGVLIGVFLFDCYYEPDSEGYINYDPKKDVINYGGHAQVLTGWKTVNDKLYWRVLNSWGESWGDHGYAWLPEDYPWTEDAYAIVDNVTEMKFKEYKEKFY